LPDLLALRRQHGFRLHVDAAYGGYHGLAEGLGAGVQTAFEALPAVDSVVIDPHKHGLQPLGCAAVLYPDASVRGVFAHEAPYCYFEDRPDAPHLGHLGLECSRAGATAAALWATLQLLPLVRGGRFAGALSRGCAVAQAWHARVQADPRWRAGPAPDLDIVTWLPQADNGPAASIRSVEVRREAQALGLYLATVQLPASYFGWAGTAAVTALRATWMKPISDAQVAAAWALLEQAFSAV
jgi:tyrosine decarboxylase/aspartate 1-decarboxylase